jgi:hypothetical protein
VQTEEVVAVEAAVGALDPVQALLGDRDRVIDVLNVLRSKQTPSHPSPAFYS